MEAGGSRRTQLIDWLIVVGLGAVVLALIWPSLGPSSLWLDDAWQALVVRAHTSDEMRLVSSTAPGYALALKGWFALVGFSSLKAQMPSVLIGVMLPGATYLVARNWRVARWPALLAGALLASSPTLLESIPRVKQFSLNALLALVLLSIAWRTIEEGSSRKYWVALVVVAMGSAVVSSAVAPVAGGSVLVAAGAMWKRGSSQRWVGLAALMIFSAFSIAWWLVFASGAANPALRTFWSSAYIDTGSLRGAVSSTTDALYRLALFFTVLPLWLIAPGVFVSAVFLASRDMSRALLLFTPMAIGVLLAAIHLAPLGTGRTDSYLYPGIALALAVATSSGITSWTRRDVVSGLVVTAMAGMLAISQLATYPQEDLRPLVEMVDGSSLGSPLVVYSITQYQYALYSNRVVLFRANSSAPMGFEVEVDGSGVTILEQHVFHPTLYLPEIRAATRGENTVWFIASHFWPDLETIHGQFSQLGFQVAARWERPGAELVKYERVLYDH